nr:dephospho-CoA kinase [Leptotrichia hongkongensis]
MVSREKLGRVIFGNREKRLILNSVMHPEILRIMREKILECKKENKIIFVEIQLLFEVQWEKEFDYILLVSAEKETQIKRILSRDNRSKEEALSIINSQMSLDEKKKRSDYVIENDGNIQDLEKKVDDFLKKIEFENILKPILN